MKQEKEKKKLKIIYDIVPPHLLRNVILAEKKVSKMVRVAYLFLRTSKYGSVALVLGVAISGGALIMGFSPKTEVTEIYPARYNGDWQNMEMALDKDLSRKANILEFNFDNSASVVRAEKKIGEFEIESGEIQNSDQESESTEGDIELIEEEIQGSDQRPEPTVEDEVEVENDKVEKNEIENPIEFDVPSSEPAESLTEEFSFFKKTKNVFFIPRAKAEETDKSATNENQEIQKTVQVGDTEPADIETEETVNDEAPTQNEDTIIEEIQDDQNLEEKKELDEDEEKTVQVGDTEPTIEDNDIDNKNLNKETENVDENNQDKEVDEEEKFEDFSGMIMVPDVDGNPLFETEEDKKKEEIQTIFTKELNAVYSDFSVSEEKGELEKISVGFSFGSIGEENEDDEIIVSWSLDGQDWRTALEFVLNKNYSNKKNGGYFYADVFDLSNSSESEILKWEDVKNIKIKFSYLTNNNEEDYVSFFLDAVWLETESEKIDEEQEEEPEEELEKENQIEILSYKKDFKINEDLEFRFKYKKEKNGALDSLISIAETIGVVDYWKDINLTAEIIGPDEKISEIPGEEFGDFSEIFTLDKNGEILMKIENNKRFKPGLYKIILRIEENGETQVFEQDFTWGVLTINVNRSIYLPGEEAYLQMGVLRNDGHTVCDADLELRIRNQELGIETLLSTQEGTIYYSGKCSGNNVTDIPDYFAYYTTDEAGIYEMKLTNLDNGYEIIDLFEVREAIPFDVERIGPSRIYPPADYEMVLKIKANEDFIGFVQEKVPASFIIIEQELKIKNLETGKFEIYDSQFITQDENDDIKLLRWYDLNLKQNDELEIRYTFDAPNVSPYLHLLGPLGFYE